MVRRFIIALSLMLLPVTTYAVTADQLGPQTNSAGTADPGAANLLQPASPGQGSLQAPGAQEGGIGQPSSQDNLQPAGERDQINSFLAGESSGASGEPEDSDPLLSLPQLILLAVMLLTGGWLGWRYLTQRRRQPAAPMALLSVDPRLQPEAMVRGEPAETATVPAEPTIAQPALRKAKKNKPRRKKHR